MIYLASDHAGFELKNLLYRHLQGQGLAVEDCGPFAYNKDDDYPDFVYPCALKVAENPDNRGIILGLSGNGEAMVANKVRGIRAAVYYGGDRETVKLSREHNDANILSLGAKSLDQAEMFSAVNEWLGTQFQAGRHQRRVEKIKSIEQETFK